jgi:Fic family protein/DNA-binding XRE family transcriptional regulator
MKYLLQLQNILKASDLSQEELARRLDVSFVSLNSWLNERAVPRVSAQAKIELLYLNIVGAEGVDEDRLKNAIIEAVASKLTVSQLLSSQDMLDNLILHMTYNTNTIEGSTMTLSDTKEVLFDQAVLSNRTQIEQLEAINHKSALLWLIGQIADDRGFAFTATAIKDLHLRLMSGILSNAGVYRNHNVRIMGAHVPLVNYRKIDEAIDELAQMINSAETINTVELLAKSHARFEQIHPFSDGNGRVGRLLMLGISLRDGIFPPIVAKERKQAYYKYLERAQTDGAYEPLMLFIAESINEAKTKLRGAEI